MHVGSYEKRLSIIWKEFLLYPAIIQLLHFIAHTDRMTGTFIISPRGVQKKLLFHVKFRLIVKLKTRQDFYNSGEKCLLDMFTGHDEPAAMNVYWSLANFTGDQTGGPVGSFIPD